MSAYLCNPEHIAALAAFAAGNGGSTNSVIYDWRMGGAAKDAENCARELAMQNINSVAARYPDDVSGNRPGPSGMTDEAYIAACGAIAKRYAARLPGLKPVDYISMCGCYEYQACESQDWVKSAAHNQIQWILKKAYRLLPGFDDAVREFSDNTVRY